MRILPVPLALAVAGALTAACADASPGVTGSEAAAAPVPTAVPSTTGPVPLTFRRFPAGVAVIGLDQEARQLTVEVKVGGLAVGTTHAVQLVKGACGQPLTLLHPLQPLVIGTDTTGDVRTTVDGVAEGAIPSGGWALVVERGATAATGALMCGDLVNEVAQTVITAGISVVIPPGGPDPKAAGTATLRITGGRLTLVLDVTGLTPGSVHAAQVRKGSCESQGAVLHPLLSLTADASGRATSTSTLPDITTIPLAGWFVSVSTAPALDPVLCGNVGS